jgi:methyl-accepting chemotaxis protein
MTKKPAVRTAAKVEGRHVRSYAAALSRAQATIEFSLDGKVVAANQNFLDALGYRLEEILGQHHRLFCDPAWVASPDYVRFWEKLNRGEADAAVYRRLGKHGREVWIQASYNPLLDEKGRLYGVLKFATDITAARNAQAETEARLAAINRVQAVIEFSLDGTVLGANDNFLRTLGYSLEEIRGRHHRMFCDPQWCASPEYQAFWARLNRGEVDAGTYRRVRKDRREVWIEASYNPVFDANGKPVKVIKFATDVTAQAAMLQNVGALVTAAGAGQLTQRLEVAALQGTARDLADSVNRLLDAVVVPLTETQRTMRRLAAGDVDARMCGDFGGEFKVLQDAVNQSIEQIGATVSRIQGASESISTASRDIAEGNASLAQRTQEQASSLEETAASIEEMTATVKQNASNATQASQLAGGARASAERGGEVVNKAVTAMGAITESSRRVADIIGVIEQIAFQTNMLALNAAVEAARAGEQGRGFAVVASEVRNLAQRSATAAKEIKDLIKDSAQKVEQGAALVNSSGEALQEIIVGVKKVTDIVSEISAASDEQARGIEQINTAVTQMDKMTQQNASLVEESSAAAAAMREQAQVMSELVAAFTSSAVANTPRAPAPKAAPPPSAAPPKKRKPAVLEAELKTEWERF